jgi:hypothetical protein
LVKVLSFVAVCEQPPDLLLILFLLLHPKLLWAAWSSFFSLAFSLFLAAKFQGISLLLANLSKSTRLSASPALVKVSCFSSNSFIVVRPMTKPRA